MPHYLPISFTLTNEKVTIILVLRLLLLLLLLLLLEVVKDRAHDNIGSDIERYRAISGDIQPAHAVSCNIARHCRDNSGTCS